MNLKQTTDEFTHTHIHTTNNTNTNHKKCDGDDNVSYSRNDKDKDYEISGSLDLTSISKSNNTMSCADFADDEFSDSHSQEYQEFYLNGLNEFKSFFSHTSLSIKDMFRQFMDKDKDKNNKNNNNMNNNYYVENGI